MTAKQTSILAWVAYYAAGAAGLGMCLANSEIKLWGTFLYLAVFGVLTATIYMLVADEKKREK